LFYKQRKIKQRRINGSKICYVEVEINDQQVNIISVRYMYIVYTVKPV